MTNASVSGGPIVLRAVGVGKQFPGVRALASVDFDLTAGEIHGVCGENGAGKSTLMKILAGIYQPDEGSISIGGRVVNNVPPRDRDIAMVFQN